MTTYFYCPRKTITPHANQEDNLEQPLCDFCWYEYCFCWSEYCLKEWYEMQIQHERQPLIDKHHTQKDEE
ncbi:hypothetical protein B6N60_00005 [Richelia sinica FACHB-800]|uniref:Uncharacterized protein n=1 Tax=Richelia sinica FACHB-800 TaxID=1357546 RepID=A0A975T4K9_9NOST|nr:hypothetical protein [Richelia sinica]MBD2665574.1 hypothetical protein [Richelia sinica FACHB-800]QXE21332.1 hypothetical protein B6N60_00005 [Richelia sinica FACHB-800]